MSTITGLPDEELVAWMLEDATLEDIEHFFVYNADLHAEHFLGSPDPDDGLRRAA